MVRRGSLLEFLAIFCWRGCGSTVAELSCSLIENQTMRREVASYFLGGMRQRGDGQNALFRGTPRAAKRFLTPFSSFITASLWIYSHDNGAHHVALLKILLWTLGMVIVAVSTHLIDDNVCDEPLILMVIPKREDCPF